MIGSDTSQQTHSVTLITRPKRVLFLVDPQKNTALDVDRIIRNCLRRWGGRFSPIVPTNGKAISDRWWEIAEAADPDIVYSLTPISEQLESEITRRILPLEIVNPSDDDLKNQHKDKMLRLHHFESYGIEGLPRHIAATRTSAFGPVQFMCPEEGYDENPVESLILRNFGAYQKDIGVINAFSDVNKQEFQARDLKSDQALEKILQIKVITPFELSAALADRPFDVGYDRSVQGFHLVVGEGVEDLMYVWNRALNSTGYNGVDVFWLSVIDANNADVIKQLREFIRRRYHPTPDNNYFGKLISYSVAEHDLSMLVGELNKKSGIQFEAQHLGSGDWNFPRIEHYRRLSSYQSTQRLTFSDGYALGDIPRPPFAGLPSAGNSDGREWMLDAAIEFADNTAISTIPRPSWLLPKRIPLSRLFFQQGITSSRVNFHGLPTACIRSSRDSIAIRVPDRFEVTRACLEKAPKLNVLKREPVRSPYGRFDGIGLSDKGKYLDGVLSVFRDLYSTGGIFEDPFWRAVVLEMTGKRSPSSEEILTEVSIGITKICDEISGNVDSEKVQKVAQEITDAIQLRRPKDSFFTKDQLEKKFSRQRGLAEKNNKETKAEIPHSYCLRFEEDKSEELEYLVEIGAFQQGIREQCPKCNTVQWKHVHELRSTLRCDGCLSEFSLSVSPSWEFRLNELIASCLRNHGTLPVIQAMYNMISVGGGMFFFTPSINVYEKGQSQPFSDIDLFVIKNRKLIIGEVKSSPLGFIGDDLSKLRDIALELQPDEVRLCATQTEETSDWPADVLQTFDKFTEVMTANGIKVVRILSKWFEGSSRPVER
jgi:hypothetical protein